MAAKQTTPEQAQQFHMALTGFPHCFDDCCFCRLERERDEARRQLAEARDALERQHAGADAVWNEKHEVMCQLVEAAEAVRLLIALIYEEDRGHWMASDRIRSSLPGWLQHKIER